MLLDAVQLLVVVITDSIALLEIGKVAPFCLSASRDGLSAFFTASPLVA